MRWDANSFIATRHRHFAARKEASIKFTLRMPGSILQPCSARCVSHPTQLGRKYPSWLSELREEQFLNDFGFSPLALKIVPKV
jgi:hypothetical protein